MKKNLAVLMCSVIVFSNIALTACDKKDNLSLNNKEKEKQIALSKEKGNILDLNIYFDSSQDQNTIEISKEERIIKRDELLAETIIHELIKGPSVKSKLTPVFPKDTRLLSVSIKDTIAYINFSKEVNVSMTANKEEACLKSIIWSLTQIPSVEKIKILIENKDADIWGGNFDLSKPIGKDDIQNVKRK